MRRFGFTLVELMIVVAIIGILASIAIPNFVAMQRRARLAELAPNIEAIRGAEQAYDAAFNAFLNADVSPGAAPSGKSATTWVPSAGFIQLGWAPDGDVRGAYRVTVRPSGNGDPTGDMVVLGEGDIDGDGIYSRYTATRSVKVMALTSSDTY